MPCVQCSSYCPRIVSLYLRPATGEMFVTSLPAVHIFLLVKGVSRGHPRLALCNVKVEYDWPNVIGAIFRKAEMTMLLPTIKGCRIVLTTVKIV